MENTSRNKKRSVLIERLGIAAVSERDTSS
jgi:hypothetical protein